MNDQAPAPTPSPEQPRQKPKGWRRLFGGTLFAGAVGAANMMAPNSEPTEVSTTPAAVAEPFAPEVTPSEQQVSGPAPAVESPAGDPEVIDEDEQPTVTNPVPPPPPVVVHEGDGDPTVIDEDEQPVINNPQPPPGEGEEIPKTS